MTRTIVIMIAAVACLALGACASDPILTSRATTAGLGATDGKATAAIGYMSGAGAVVPYVNKKTGQQYVVPGPCGGFNAVSVSANVAGSANSGGAVGTTMVAGINDDLAVGEPAVLAKLAAIQQAAGASHNVLADYRDCSRAMVGSNTAAAASGATTFNAAAASK